MYESDPDLYDNYLDYAEHEFNPNHAAYDHETLMIRQVLLGSNHFTNEQWRMFIADPWLAIWWADFSRGKRNA